MRDILRRGSRRTHFLTGVYFSGLGLAIIAIVLTDAPTFRFELDMSIRLSMIGLFAGIAFAIAARLERPWVPILMVPFGALATLVSMAYQIAYNPGINPGGCNGSSVQSGFPFPWSSTYNFVGSRCLLLYIPMSSHVIDTVSFFLDVLFYAAVGVAIIQLFRATTGRTAIPSVFPILSNGKDNQPRRRYVTGRSSTRPGPWIASALMESLQGRLRYAVEGERLGISA